MIIKTEKIFSNKKLTINVNKSKIIGFGEIKEKIVCKLLK